MTTIAKLLKYDFAKGSLSLFDSNGNQTYFENSDGYWSKREYNSNGKETYYENSDGYWVKSEYNSNGNRTYYENSEGYWYKFEFDSNGKETYSEDSKGTVRDNRPKPNCGGKTVTVDGIEYELKAKEIT